MNSAACCECLRQRCCVWPAWPSQLASTVPAEVASCELCLDSRALALGYRLGSDTLLVLLDLASRAVDTAEGIVVAASYRDIARRLGISKDTVGRRVLVLRNSGVVVQRGEPCEPFGTRSYILRLELAGVTRVERSVAAA